jgi:FKBP-type peptidyl-prolyl cis-trans isomerase
MLICGKCSSFVAFGFSSLLPSRAAVRPSTPLDAARPRCSASQSKGRTEPSDSSSGPNLVPSLATLSRRHFMLSAAATVAFTPLARASAAVTKGEEKPQVGFVTPSGLRYFDFHVGGGAKPKWGDWVELDYALYTVTPGGDALVMADSTFNKKDRSLVLHHGNGEAILGLEEAVHSMKQGGRRRVIIPPDLAYALPGRLPIPLGDRARRKFFEAMNDTGGTVVVDVEILNVLPFPDEHGYYSDPTPSAQELNEILTEAYKEGVAKSQGQSFDTQQ